MYLPAIQIAYRLKERARISDTLHTSSLILKNWGFFSKIENVMFAPKDLRPGEMMALRILSGGRKGNMPQTLKGIAQSACLLACLGAGAEHEQS
jgi:hypothetical protein